jgi:hypothetical protein
LIVETLAAFLVPFGVEPAIVTGLVRQRWRAWPKYGHVFQTVFAYGAACVVIAPVMAYRCVSKMAPARGEG